MLSALVTPVIKGTSMPLTSCPVCGSIHNVETDVLGQMIRCRKCSARYKAVTTKSGVRPRSSSNALIFIVGGVVVLFLVIIVMTMGPSEDLSGDGRAAASAEHKVDASSPDSAASSSAPVKSANTPDGITQRCLLAIDREDYQQLMSVVSYPRFQEELVRKGLATRPWSELDSAGQTLARKSVTELLVGTEEQRRFFSVSKVASLSVAKQDARDAEVHVMRRSVADEKQTQEEKFFLCNVDDRWYVRWVERGEVLDPGKLAAKAADALASSAGRRERMGLGAIEIVEHLPATSEEDRRRIDDLVRTMTDLNETRKASAAKRDLVAIGKPAIPAVLNAIVGKEVLATIEDRQIVNLAVQALEEITLLDFGYAPGGSAGDMTGDVLEDNLTGLKRWFGWWKANHKTWTGPKPPEEEKQNQP